MEQSPANFDPSHMHAGVGTLADLLPAHLRWTLFLDGDLRAIELSRISRLFERRDDITRDCLSWESPDSSGWIDNPNLAYRGSVPLTSAPEWDYTLPPYGDRHEYLAFQELLKLIKQDGRQAVVFATPRRGRSSYLRRIYLEHCRRICERAGATYLDLDQVAELQDRRLFIDATHMTQEGARRFSEHLADALRNAL